MRREIRAQVRPRPWLLVAGALLLAASAQGATVTVRDAWVREPAPNRKETGAFAVVENAGTETRAIVGATSEVTEKVELHEMKLEGSMMRMSPVAKIEIPAGGKVELKPGSLHLMLFGIKKPLVPGEEVALTIQLDDGTTLSFPAPVRKRDAAK